MKLLLSVSIAVYLALTAARVYVRKYYVFLPDYVRWTLTTPAPVGDRPTHVFFLFVDHFEPDLNEERVRRWAERYRALAARHHDHSGRAPQHTFFYPGEQIQNPRVMEELGNLTSSGLAEVELHYHHGGDTAATLRVKIRTAIDYFQQFGFLKTIDGQTRFGFVHGNFGLDNSMGDAMCGVNGELRLLRELGCYGDFSFPSLFEDAQPPFVNTLYAARDDDEPKSYRRQWPLSMLATNEADLLIFPGPLLFAPTANPRRLFIALDDGNVHPAVDASGDRVDRWVRANIHVPSRPDWVFVKAFAHGASSPADQESVLGPGVDAALSHFEQRYNDGRRYILHYITAREAYNLVRAAVDNRAGEPEQFYDYVVPPYVANARRAAE